VVGYELDDSHWPSSGDTAMEVMGDGGKSKEKEAEKRMKVVYLLPGGFMSTEAMAAGKKILHEDVVLGEGKVAVAAWD